MNELAAQSASTEFLACVAARQLEGRGRVFAGIGIPTLAVDLARRTTSPELEIVYESGVVGADPSAMAEGVADFVLVSGAESVLPMYALFGYVLQGGHIDIGFLGAAQIDRFGSINTSVIGPWEQPTARLPGSGGAADIIPHAREVFVVLRRHDPQSLVGELDFCTTPSPARAALEPTLMQPPGFGVSLVITPKAVLRRTERLGELELAAVHPGNSVEGVVAAAGWPLRVADDVTETKLPSAEDIRLLRDEIDPVRLYLR